MGTVSLQPFLDPTRLFLLTLGTAHKTAQGTSPPAPQLIFHLHEGQMDDAGLWHPCPHPAMAQIHQAPPCLHPAPPRRSCTSYRINQRLMNSIFCPNISAQRALPAMKDAGTLRCDLALEVSALDVHLHAVTMKSS